MYWSRNIQEAAEEAYRKKGEVGMSETQNTYIVTGIISQELGGPLHPASVMSAARRIVEHFERAASGSTAMTDVIKDAEELVYALQTCHICKCVVLVDEGPIHCEDCSSDCEDHEEPNCPSISDLHSALKRALAGAAAVYPASTKWMNLPNEQAWWWHWNGEDLAIPHIYSVMYSGTAKRYFIAYPDSRWCEELGGFWLKVQYPNVPSRDEQKSLAAGTREAATTEPAKEK